MELSALFPLYFSFLLPFLLTFLYVLKISIFGLLWLLFYSVSALLLGAVLIGSVYGNSFCHKLHHLQSVHIRSIPNQTSVRQKLPKLDRRLTGSSLVDEQLQEILHYVFRDYIYSWYSLYFKRDDEFPHLLRSELNSLIIDFSAICKDINWLQFCTEDLINDIATHVRLYRAACKNQEPEFTTEQVFFQLEEKELGYSREAVCIDQITEKDYFLALSHQLLYMHGSHRSFECLPFRELAKEILATQIFQALLRYICDPDYLNQTIIWIFCTAEYISISNEAFVQVLRASTNLNELRCLESMLHVEIALQRARDTNDTPGANDEVKAKLSSLLYIKNLLVNRIRHLANGSDDNRSQYSLDSATSYNDFARMVPIRKMTLTEVMDNSLALSFFMNYIETKSGTPLIHLYLTCVGFQASAEQLLEEYTKTGMQNKLELLRSQGLAIIQHYFSNQTQYQVSIEDENLLKRARRLLTQDIPSALAFREMQDKLLSVIQETYFAPFEQSEKYLKMLWELDLLRPMEEGESGPSEITGENRLQSPSRLAASIVSTMECAEPGSRKTFTNYIIDVTAYFPNGSVKKWQVHRRYMEFHDLHVQIEKKFPNLVGLNFPGKKLNNMGVDVLSRRKIELHLYLQTLLFEDVQKNNEGLGEMMISFLLPKKYEMTRGEVERKLDNVVHPLFSSMRSMTNAVKSVPQNVLKLSDTLKDGFAKALNLNVEENGSSGSFYDSEINENIPLRIMMALMDEIFDLKNTNQFWLRSQVITILKGTMKAVYGDKMNKMIVDYMDDLTSTKEIAKALAALKNSLWPNGLTPEAPTPRDDKSKYSARVCAKAVLLTTITEQLQATMGSQTAKRGALRFFDLLQHSALNRRLFYVVLEGMLSTLYEKYPLKKSFVTFHTSHRVPRRNAAGSTSSSS